jgi:DNA-binding IclR family transcriptional regulator
MNEPCEWQRLLGALQDKRWHTVKEVSRKSRVAESHVQKVFDFLAEFNMADQRNKNIRLKPEMETLQES